MLRHRITKTWNCKRNKSLVKSEQPVECSPSKHRILIMLFVVSIVFRDVESNILCFNFINCQVFYLLSFYIIFFRSNKNWSWCSFRVTTFWYALLVWIRCSPLKQDVLVEEEVSSQHSQSHIGIKHHPVNLLALLKSRESSVTIVERKSRRDRHIFPNAQADKVDHSLWEISTVPEDQSTKASKLWNGIVGKHRSLVALFTFYTDSDMSGLDHVYIVGAVADSQRYLTAISLSYKVNDVRFVQRLCAIYDDSWSFWKYFFNEVKCFFMI